MREIAKILTDLHFDFFVSNNLFWVGNKQIRVSGQYVYFSYPKSEIRLKHNNPMMKSWIRNYITKGTD